VKSDPISPAEVFREYGARNAYWAKRKPKAAYRPKRDRPAEPLILGGYGVHLGIERDALLIRDGLTHAGQERATHRFFKGDPLRPPRIVMLDGSGSLSFDVITWLAEQGIPLFKVDYQGELVSIVAGRSAYDPERVLWQVQTRADPTARLAFASELIANKLTASLQTLEEAIPKSPYRELAIVSAIREIKAIQSGDITTINGLRLAEARAAARYFKAWKPLTINWRDKWRRQIPENWQNVSSRRSFRSRNATNRNATHPVQAMLNYSYAVLHSAVQTEAVADGYDPARGIMHETRPDASAIILDLMEPRRPVVDGAVIRFLTSNLFSGADFTLTDKGVCRLTPELAKRVAALV
jgi:CRISPR-associated protein Cas1